MKQESQMLISQQVVEILHIKIKFKFSTLPMQQRWIILEEVNCLGLVLSH